MKKIFRNIIGILLLLLGIVCGPIPVVQGWIFFLLGYVILDFKKKDKFEVIVIKLLKKIPVGRTLAFFWERVKNKNKVVIKEEREEKIKNIFHDIRKE